MHDCSLISALAFARDVGLGATAGTVGVALLNGK